MNWLLHSKLVQVTIHLAFVAFALWFFFPNLFTHRDVPRWPFFANHTVLGTDRNHNNLRDDVEIQIHRKYKNDQDYLAAIRYAAALQRRLSVQAKTRSEALETFRNESCNSLTMDIEKGNKVGPFFYERLLFNTKERIDISRKNVMFEDGGGDIREFMCGSNVDNSEAFEEYSLRPKKK